MRFFVMLCMGIILFLVIIIGPTQGEVDRTKIGFQTGDVFSFKVETISYYGYYFIASAESSDSGSFPEEGDIFRYKILNATPDYETFYWPESGVQAEYTSPNGTIEEMTLYLDMGSLFTYTNWDYWEEYLTQQNEEEPDRSINFQDKNGIFEYTWTDEYTGDFDEEQTETFLTNMFVEYDKNTGAANLMEMDVLITLTNGTRSGLDYVVRRTAINNGLTLPGLSLPLTMSIIMLYSSLVRTKKAKT